MTLTKTVSDRLRAGALIILVEDADEALALAHVKAACAAAKLNPTVLSAANSTVSEVLEKHSTDGKGALVLTDFLRVYGSNPLTHRMIREVALQTRKPNEGFSRLILIEAPGVDVPKVLRGDIEYIAPTLPTVAELTQELQDFLKTQNATLPGNGETLYAVASSVAGLARHEASRLFARCWVELKTLDPKWLRKEKAARVAERLGGALTFIDTDTPEVGGLDELKAWLNSRRSAFGSAAARTYGLPEPKGVLLLGIPGTGKSLTAKTVGREWGLPVLRLDAGKLFGSLVGQSEAQTRQAIEAAEASAPCVLWIDEIEKGLAGAKGGSGDSGTSQRVFGTLLTWLQEKKAPVFVVATANNVSSLPPELLRKGRFDEIFFMDLPSAEERSEIAKIHILNRKRKVADLKPAVIAEATDGFSGAEIEQAIIEAMFRAYADNGRDVTLDDILSAAKCTVPLSKTMAKEIGELREWAAGRARRATSTAVEAPTTIRRAPRIEDN